MAPVDPVEVFRTFFVTVIYLFDAHVTLSFSSDAVIHCVPDLLYADFPRCDAFALPAAHWSTLLILPRTRRRLQNDPPSGVTGAPMDTNIMLWQAVIFGPDDTPWEGGTFKLVLEFTEDYPNKAPQVRFLTKMFHPNIYNDGQICLDILQNQWSPIYDISAILTSIQSLLCDPNPSSPANSEASRLYNENRREYNRRVKEIVEQSWIDES